MAGDYSYSIAQLAVTAFLREVGFDPMGINAGGFSCEEGAAQVVAQRSGTTHLVIASAKRRRGGTAEPKASAAKMRRMAMAYLVAHPDVESISVDVCEALIGERATVTVAASMGAYTWERG